MSFSRRAALSVLTLLNVFSVAAALRTRDIPPDGLTLGVAEQAQAKNHSRVFARSGGLARLVGDTNNLCIQDRLVPQFFLLGAPKGGTSFLFEQLVTSEGMRTYKLSPGEPAYHVKEPWTFAGGFGGNDRLWAEHWPKCTGETRQVATDATPGYFGDPEAIHGIKQVYGRHGVHQALVFMVLLREPMSRAQSHYYYMILQGVKRGTSSACTPAQFPATFKQGVQEFIKKGDPHVCQCACDHVWFQSTYVSSFRNYFLYFPGEQLHVTTFQHAQSRSLPEYLWNVLRVPHGTGEPDVIQNNLKNSNKHPGLEDDLDSDLLSQFQASMDREARPENIAEMLSNNHAHLFGYDGEANDVPSIANWLRMTWV